MLKLRGIAGSHLLALLWILAPASAAQAQSYPTGCAPISSTYECMAILTGAYDYTHNTCGTHEYRATEAESFQDELNEWSGVCGLQTTRNGWLTSSTSVGFCGFTDGEPDYQFGVEVTNVSNYTFEHWQTCQNQTIVTYNNYAVIRNRNQFCPQGWGYSGSQAPFYCRRNVSQLDPQNNMGCPEPSCGNPIGPAIGNKYQEETDYASAGSEGLVLKRYYNSALEWASAYRTVYYWAGDTWNGSWLGYGQYGKLAMHPESQQFAAMAIDAIGAQWRHHYQRGIHVNVGSSITTAMAYRHDGKVITFNLYQGSYISRAGTNDSLSQLPDGRFQYVNASDESIETYTSSGYLESIRSRSGRMQTLGYDTCNRISTVTDDFGRALQFNYQHNCGAADRIYRITSVQIPGGALIQYGYNMSNGTLTSVTYPDGTLRAYSYGGSNGRKLTGIVDEQGQQFATWGYDTADRASLSEHFGGADRVTITYAKAGSQPWNIERAKIIDQLGSSTRYFYTVVRGTNRVSQIERPHPSGTGVMNEYWTYDTNGNVATYKNYRGYRTNFSYDLARNLETSRTEGLNSNGSANPETRTISTQWHPAFRLPILVSETGRTTAYTYDANGNPLTKTITDTATSNTRSWTWSYDSYGRMLTADGPRTDAADVTTYTYYTCATGYECGQLATVTNAAGHVTSYPTYNVHGQPLAIVDPNNVTTLLTYDLRQRLTSRSVGGETTGFSYWPTGLLKRVTAPDGSYIEYSYDGAHRLTQIADDENNRVVYTLDAMGNHTQEQNLDSSGTVVRAHYRTVDLLNRLKQEIGSANTPAVTTAFTYDNQGNLANVAAPLGRSTAHAYDKLDRLIQTTDSASGITGLTYNERDDLTSVTDPRGLLTNYSYNGFGDLTQLTSPDTGTTTHAYDSGGNPQSRTDARSQSATYGHDALNRITSAVHSDQTIGYSYDSGTNGVGRLTGLTDISGSTSWTYTAQGRVATRAQVTSGLTRYVGYSYDGAGRLSTLSYPSGVVITYGYTAGKLTSITSGSETILSGVLYDPFGPIRGWTWGNASQTVRGFDLDGNLDLLDSGGLKTYAQDDAFRITGITDAEDPGKSWSYGYDLLDRLTGASRAGLSQGWTYDANGNRLSQTGTSASTYSMSGTSNRLNGVSGALSRSYGYDAAGNATADGTGTFGYDGAGRLTSASKGGTSASYVHNALGQRVRKTVNGTSTIFSYDESGHLLGEYEASGALIREYVWLGDIPVAVITGGPGTPPYVFWYVHADHLNTPRSVENPTTGELVWRWDSAPFGETVPNEDPDGDFNLFSLPLRFPGQYADQETGLNYNYFRDYGPAIGRYVQSDPIGLVGGINTFGYAEQNPIHFFDVLGLESSATQALCRQAGIPTEAERCIDQAECFEKAKNGMIACQRFGSVIRKMACIRCWEAYESTCPGKSPGKGCDKQACKPPRQENRVVRL